MMMMMMMVMMMTITRGNHGSLPHHHWCHRWLSTRSWSRSTTTDITTDTTTDTTTTDTTIGCTNMMMMMMWIETTIVPINKLCNRLIVSKARPRIVVSAVLESNNHLIVRRATIDQCLHHSRWYNLILETRDEHDGKVGFQFLDSINVSPLVSTQELKVFEIGQCNVNHVGNTGERIFDNESLDLLLSLFVVIRCYYQCSP